MSSTIPDVNMRILKLSFEELFYKIEWPGCYGTRIFFRWHFSNSLADLKSLLICKSKSVL